MSDIEDYDIPEKTIISCPCCKNNPEKKKTCDLCNGRGYLPITNQDYPGWREDL